MSLNWGIGTFVDIISVIGIAIQLLIMLYHYHDFNFRQAVFLLGVYASLTLTDIFRLIGSLFLWEHMMLLGVYFIPAVGVCVMLLADSFTRDTMSPSN